MEKETQKKASAATATQSSPAIWMKIFRVQKGLKGFVQKEDSAKQKDSGDPAYRYVPGYEINKEFHRLLDENVLMCECSDVYSQNQIVDSWVNKLINGNVVPVTKREMLFTVYKDFWFRDPETGDRTPAVRSMGVGMNGFDKSAATANSVAERYFILKYFHVPCADSASEIDAHDDSYVPGLEKFRNAPSGAAPTTAPVQPPIPAATAQTVTTSRQATPDMAAQPWPATTGLPQSQGSLFGDMPKEEAQPHGDSQPTPEEAWSMAAEILSRFAEGTVTYQKKIDQAFTRLTAYGYADTDSMRAMLESEARAIRNGGARPNKSKGNTKAA